MPQLTWPLKNLVISKNNYLSQVPRHLNHMGFSYLWYWFLRMPYLHQDIIYQCLYQYHVFYYWYNPGIGGIHNPVTSYPKIHWPWRSLPLCSISICSLIFFDIFIIHVFFVKLFKVLFSYVLHQLQCPTHGFTLFFNSWHALQYNTCSKSQFWHKRWCCSQSPVTNNNVVATISINERERCISVI